MDRALSIELLTGALGDNPSLPTPAELQRSLADAEVGLVRGLEGLNEDVLEVGWYLHGIASADASLELYGIERQRRAFQVFAHIFDLALTDPDLGLTDRLRLSFASQVAYWNSGLQPNALAVYRRVEQQGGISLVGDAERVALHVGVATLGGDTDWMWNTLKALRQEAARLSEEWGVESLIPAIYGGSGCDSERVPRECCAPGSPGDGDFQERVERAGDIVDFSDYDQVANSEGPVAESEDTGDPTDEIHSLAFVVWSHNLRKDDRIFIHVDLPSHEQNN